MAINVFFATELDHKGGVKRHKPLVMTALTKDAVPKVILYTLPNVEEDRGLNELASINYIW